MPPSSFAELSEHNPIGASYPAPLVPMPQPIGWGILTVERTVKFLASFKEIGPKYARNMLMDA